MNYQIYKNQVALLLTVLPYVGEETAFALHGGTAINLFQQNMPRLSVDIDLTYLPITDRETSMADINQKLSAIKEKIIRLFPNVKVVHKKGASKLLINTNDSAVKVEVNQIKRGCFADIQKLILSEKAQNQFNTFCEVPVVEKGHLYGGKICAALDRQHPRDIFDIHYMFSNNDFSPSIKKGFIFYLISSNRPIAEMLNPNLKHQRDVLENQFSGMTEESFSYDDFENTRKNLINLVNQTLTVDDKIFLKSIEMGSPIWEIYNFSIFPAVNWKLNNVLKLINENKPKYLKQLEKLNFILNI